MIKPSIRSYRDGDETVLSQVFNTAYAHFNGSSTKDAYAWKTSFVNHPFIGSNRILVACPPRPPGYIAYGNDGLIYDLCVEESLDRASTLYDLVTHALRKAHDENVYDIRFAPPKNDYDIKYILKSLGVIQIKPNNIECIKIVNMEKCIKDIVQGNLQKFNFAFNILFIIHLDFTPSSQKLFNEYDTQFEMNNSQSANPPRTIITCGWKHLQKIIMGTDQIWTSLITGKMRIQPAVNTAVALKFLRALRPRNSWFVPLIDWR